MLLAESEGLRATAEDAAGIPAARLWACLSNFHTLRASGQEVSAGRLVPSVAALHASRPLHSSYTSVSQKRVLDVRSIRILVFDEADEMLKVCVWCRCSCCVML